MKGFYRIRHRTFHARGMPWITGFMHGLVYTDQCTVCTALTSFPNGDLRARLEPIGTQWPDLIGCGHGGLFVASSRFVEMLRSCDVLVRIGGHVEFDEPAPKRLSLADAPAYYWVDGEQHLAAKMDFEASGFVGTRYCPSCGSRSYDIRATKDIQFVFDYDASSGLDLFSTDMNSQAFFCTERVLECVRQHRPTNVAITRVADGESAKPIKFW